MEKDTSERDENREQCQDVLQEFLEKYFGGKEKTGTARSRESLFDGGSSRSSRIPEQPTLAIPHHHRHRKKHHKKHHHHHHHHHRQDKSHVSAVEHSADEASRSRKQFPTKSSTSCSQTAVGHCCYALSTAKCQHRKRKERPREETLVRNKMPHCDVESDSEVSPMSASNSNCQCLATDHGKGESVYVPSNVKTSELHSGTVICECSHQLLPVCSAYVPSRGKHNVPLVDLSSKKPDISSNKEIRCRDREGMRIGSVSRKLPYGVVSTPVSDSGHGTAHTKVMYRCHVCGKAFVCPSYLQQHMRIRTGEKPYKCQVCSEAFRQSSTLKDHTRVHTGDKPYRCPACNQAYGHSCTLKRHVNAVHRSKRPHICQTCGKAYSQASVLKKHTRVHTGDKP